MDYTTLLARFRAGYCLTTEEVYFLLVSIKRHRPSMDASSRRQADIDLNLLEFCREVRVAQLLRPVEMEFVPCGVA